MCFWKHNNEKNLRHISDAYRYGRLSHAYIIEGSAGSGKEDFADYIAAALLCERAQEAPLRDGILLEPCGRCPSCIKAATGNHPDIIHVRHEKDTVLSVGEIREQVVSDISIKPYYGPYKIYLIPQAQLMNENAQNALLKTIEEPQSYGLIFLLTDNADGFLQTIRSRCICLHMADLPRQMQVQRLMDEDGQKILEIMRRIPAMTAVEIYKTSKEIEPMETEKILSLFQMWLRDLLVFKSTGEEKRLYFHEYWKDIRSCTEKVSYEQLYSCILAFRELNTRLHVNVKAEAAYESFLLQIRAMLA